MVAFILKIAIWIDEILGLIVGCYLTSICNAYSAKKYKPCK
jgi:hypothetical protein